MTADSEANSVAVGLAAVGVSRPKSSVTGDVAAILDGSVSSASGLAVIATSTRTAEATSFGVDAGLIAVGVSKPLAEITSAAVTSAIVGPGSTVTIGSGAVSVTATATNTANAFTRNNGGGLVKVTALSPEAAVRAQTLAELNGNVGTTVTGPGADGIIGTLGVAGAGSVTVSARRPAPTRRRRRRSGRSSDPATSRPLVTSSCWPTPRPTPTRTPTPCPVEPSTSVCSSPRSTRTPR